MTDFMKEAHNIMGFMINTAEDHLIFKRVEQSLIAAHAKGVEEGRFSMVKELTDKQKLNNVQSHNNKTSE